MIYLDHAATTPMWPEVIETVSRAFAENFANSGTVYRIGMESRACIEEATRQIAETLQVPDSHRIIFTSGGSESNNLFIKGILFPDKTGACLGLEHPSVTECLTAMQGTGARIHQFTEMQTGGRAQLDVVSACKEHGARLLCVSQVNHELGAVNPVRALKARLNKESPRTRLFVDGAQAVGKQSIPSSFWEGLAGYSLSAHKFGGPKGIGALIYDSRLDLFPLIHGGGQQTGVRSGTLPTPLILGLAKALQISVQSIAARREKLLRLRRRLLDALQALQSNDLALQFNSSLSEEAEEQEPGILNFSFPPVEGEVLLHHLESKEIYVGLGSACSARSKEPSKILTRIGKTRQEALCSLRISMGIENSESDVDQFVAAFGQAYQTLFPAFAKGARH
ncbi:MAG: aminotransferase class V-fold PLP-dependent enzyme [Candidatus Nitrohelix vancouverensis]|uniref:Aminotransferase class V-fold PLP-dependent enzyme n=1 Tax=Candidatus Nitrohelix vancouverensis TaxID=2705534 RepID=A0A7T0G3U1_9BACT|nr:MAG: aminotransferase class V-fold PLP-dependent enzyme [Candidatus Nitrohelix vancouverensis]